MDNLDNTCINPNIKDNPKPTITIYVAGHGAENYDTLLSSINPIFNTDDFRLLSLAGRPLTPAYSIPIKEDKITFTSNSVFITSLIDIFQKNKDKGTMINLIEFIKKNKQLYKDILTTAIQNPPKELTNIKGTEQSFNTSDYCRIKVPTYEKLFSLSPSNQHERGLVLFGIYVIDSRFTPEHLNFLEPGKNLQKLDRNEKKILETYISDKYEDNENIQIYLYNILEKLTNRENLLLSELLLFLYHIGYNVINTIDSTCRGCLSVTDALYDETNERTTRRLRRREEGPITSLMNKKQKTILEKKLGGTKKNKNYKKYKKYKNKTRKNYKRHKNKKLLLI